MNEDDAHDTDPQKSEPQEPHENTTGSAAGDVEADTASGGAPEE